MIEKGLKDPWTPPLHFRPPARAPSICFTLCEREPQSCGQGPMPVFYGLPAPPNPFREGEDATRPLLSQHVELNIPARPIPEVPLPSLPAIRQGLEQGNFVRSSRTVSVKE